MKQIKQVVLHGTKDMLEVIYLMAGLLLFVEIVLCVVLKINPSENVVPFGTILQVILGGIFLVATLGFSFIFNANRMIRFGVPRKSVLIGNGIVAFVNSVIWFVFVGITLAADIAVNRWLNPNATTEKVVEILSGIKINHFADVAKIILPVCLVMVVFSLICGAIILAFGKAGFWALYAFMFGGLLFSVRIGDIIKESDSIAGQILRAIAGLFTPQGWAVVGAVAVIGMFVWAVRKIFRLEVKDTFG